MSERVRRKPNEKISLGFKVFVMIFAVFIFFVILGAIIYHTKETTFFDRHFPNSSLVKKAFSIFK